MPSLSLSEARKNLSSIIHSVSAPNSSPIEINVRGKSMAVILSQAEYQRMKNALLDKEIDAIFDDFDELNKGLSKR